MKALSLNQPHASAIVVGAKTIETRSRRTHYRGPLAIHASASRGTGPRGAHPFKHIFEGILETCMESRFLFTDNLAQDFDTLPFGAVIATCELVDCVRVEDIRGRLSELELGWGNYSDGRFAWVLAAVHPLEKPIAAKGMLGLWEWRN